MICILNLSLNTFPQHAGLLSSGCGVWALNTLPQHAGQLSSGCGVGALVICEWPEAGV